MSITTSLGLEAAGITDWADLYRNPSYEELFEHETDPALEGLERGVVTSLGAVAVDTGKFTGRSPKAKYFVDEDVSRGNIWWAGPDRRGSDNKPITDAIWKKLLGIAQDQLNGKKLYVIDAYAGANPDTRLKVRVICEVAWQAHFCKNMFIRPTEDELRDFVPDWTILNASKASNPDWEEDKLSGPEFIAFNVKEGMTVIGGTWYGGEMKKGIFTMMNYFLPLRGVGAFHCSANEGKKGDTALFFGLSGTGKTTLSTDPHRALIGDDEHGWDDKGVFNFEGGCYAKCINLSREQEPEIYSAIRRDALLENVVYDAKGVVDFNSTKKTENTRVSYPLYHIENIVRPISRGGHPKHIIFLTCDAFGVLPPVARLTRDQAMYLYLCGYTAKVAGTEVGVTEPKAAFSSCFGAPFLLLHPTKYADVLGKKIDEHGSRAYLVNTGWTGGPYGVGKRMSIKITRTILDRIFDGTLLNAPCEPMPLFGLDVPTAIPGIDPEILNPRDTWRDPAAYDAALQKLAAMFVESFKTYTDTPNGKALEAVGPKI